MRRPPDLAPPGTRTCTIPGCPYKHAAKGLCAKHYARVRQGTDLTAVACPGWLAGIPGACGRLHPLHEPPDPPLPDGLMAVVDQLLEEWLGR